MRLRIGSDDAIVQRLESLEDAAREAQRILNEARNAISTAERAVSEARFNERSCRERAEAQGRLAVSLGERLQALSSNRQNVSAELGQLEEGQVREKLQAALQVKSERERVLGDARAALEQELQR